MGAEAAAQRETFEQFSGVLSALAFADWLAAYKVANTALWDSYARGEVSHSDLHLRRFETPLREFGLDPAHATAVGEAYVTAYRNHWRLNEGAEQILESASRLGTVGIISNGFSSTQRAKIARFRLERWVSHVILSEEVGAMKPAREIFDAAVTAADGADSRKVYVGDSFEKDILGAKNAGWLPILFNPLGLRVPGPVLYVTRLHDLLPMME